ncbi:MAG: hypothetical protein KAJ63_02105, partial [Methyloprofundus sp.]|nr:hypothetical protein [Methyloprofundus sp.]
LTIIAEKEQRQKAKQAREAELTLLLGQQEIIWKAVNDFIDKKNAYAYDKATKHLINLRDLAEFEKKGEEFNQRLSKLKETYSKSRALLQRFNSIDLVK